MRVSVVIPIYNVADFLPQALASVRAQTRPVDEVIVVDDGSTDGSAEIARRLGATCLATPVNSGPGAARNIGVRAASGDVVAFLDGDDFWEPRHCELAVALLERFPEAALAFGQVRKVGLRTFAPPPAEAIPDGVPTEALLALIECNAVPQSGAVVRRSTFLEVGGYYEAMRYSEDFDLWLRIASRYPVVCTHEVTTNYRVHQAQATQSQAALFRGGWEARRRLWRSLADRPPEVREQVAAALRQAWELELRLTWRRCDRTLLDTLLAQRDAVPEAGPIHDRWTKRLRRYWALWVPAMTVWDWLPQGTKDVLKSPVRTLRGNATA